MCVVLLSRLLFFPDGPWEQDEALFATGVLDFNPVRHRPHPPGFPGWILLGKAFTLLTGDALQGLRAASSIASTVLFVVLASLLARITKPLVALACAAAFSFVPVVWVHAPRAFSSTPALGLAVGALYCWCRLPTARSTVVGWALLGAAATVRPQLAPTLIIIAAAGIWRDRRDLQRLALGILAAIAVVLAAYGYAAYASGGARAYWVATRAHFATHTANIAGSVAWTELGLIRGFVRPSVAVGVAAVTAIGGLAAVRRDRALGGWLLVLLGLTAWMVLRNHHPAFPRYSVAVVLVAAPLVATACDLLPRRFGAVVLFAGAVAGMLGSLAALFAMRDSPLPPVAALRSTARLHPTALGFSHGNFSFVRLAHLDGTFPAPIIDVHSVEQSAPLPPGAFALAGSSLRFLPGVTVCRRTFDAFPDAVRSLSQGRFDRTVIARTPILLGAGVHRPERDRDGVPFAWLSDRTTLFAPAGATTLALSLSVPRQNAPVTLRVLAGAAPNLHQLASGNQLLRLPLDECHDGCAVELAFPETNVPARGARALSVKLVAAWPEGPGFSPAASSWSPGVPASVRGAGAVVNGVWGPEEFWDEQRGAWTKALATAVVPAGDGKLEVKLARPKHASGPVTLSTAIETREVDVSPTGTVVTLQTDGGAGHTTLRIESETFVPSQVNPKSRDSRELGVILFEVRYVPAQDNCSSPATD